MFEDIIVDVSQAIGTKPLQGIFILAGVTGHILSFQ